MDALDSVLSKDARSSAGVRAQLVTAPRLIEVKDLPKLSEALGQVWARTW